VGKAYGLFIQLMTLEESDSIIICLWCKRGLEGKISIALTISQSLASLDSIIPVDIEKRPRIIPWWFHKTPPIHEGSGFPSEDPSTFHLKLLPLEGDHVTTNLGF
jgi:hypothetical protein